MHLRPATVDDAAILFTWRTDPLTQAASHNSGELVYADHVEWLKRSLTMPNRRIYIATLGANPVGTVRTDVVDGITELSWTVSPEHRGRGYGKRMVTTAVGMLTGPVRAEIKAENGASRRIAEAAGFQYVSESDGVLHFHYGAPSISAWK